MLPNLKLNMFLCFVSMGKFFNFLVSFPNINSNGDIFIAEWVVEL
jgi:hypothetical protein